MLDQIAALARLVWYGHDVRLAEAEAADVLLELDELLQHHAVRSGAVVGLEQLFLVVDLIDVLPATPEERLQDGGTPDIVQQRVPLNRVFQIAQGLGSDVHVLRVGLLWQQHRLRDGHAELLRQRSVEEFIVGRPPKRIVDDVGALQHGVLQIAAIVGHLMRDAVDNDPVARWFADGRPAETHEFSGDAFRSAEIVDPVDERRGETKLPPAQQSNFHRHSLLSLDFCSCFWGPNCLQNRPAQGAPAAQAAPTVIPARVSATTCRTTALRSPVSLYTRNCRSALVPSRRIAWT